MIFIHSSQIVYIFNSCIVGQLLSPGQVPVIAFSYGLTFNGAATAIFGRGSDNKSYLMQQTFPVLSFLQGLMVQRIEKSDLYRFFEKSNRNMNIKAGISGQLNAGKQSFRKNSIPAPFQFRGMLGSIKSESMSSKAFKTRQRSAYIATKKSYRLAYRISRLKDLRLWQNLSLQDYHLISKSLQFQNTMYNRLMSQAQSKTSSPMPQLLAGRDRIVCGFYSIEETDNFEACRYNRRMAILLKQTSRLGTEFIGSCLNVPHVDIPHYDSILQYIQVHDNLTQLNRKNFLLYLQEQINHGSLEFLQIIYDRIPLFLLPDLVQAASSILLWAGQFLKQSPFTAQQIQTLSQHPSLVCAFANPAMQYLKVEMAVDIWGRWYFIAPPITLSIIRHYLSCLLNASNQTLLPEGGDTSCEESLSSDNLCHQKQNRRNVTEQ